MGQCLQRAYLCALQQWLLSSCSAFCIKPNQAKQHQVNSHRCVKSDWGVWCHHRGQMRAMKSKDKWRQAKWLSEHFQRNIEKEKGGSTVGKPFINPDTQAQLFPSVTYLPFCLLAAFGKRNLQTIVSHWLSSCEKVLQRIGISRRHILIECCCVDR